MIENKEISSLFHLIDDPDEDVYSTVSDKIISFGKAIIPNLENLWENTPDGNLQERIELLIHRVHFRDLCDDFKHWKSGHANLLDGALLVAKYHYPDLQTTPIVQELEKIRRNIWLELNNYLTPMEQVNVLTSILYNYYKLKGVEFAYDNPDDYLINKEDNVKSVITYNKVDCGNFKSQILKMTVYDGYQGKGKVLEEYDLKSEWIIGEAETAGEKVLISVCKS